MDDPAIQRRHQVIAFRSRNELVRPDQLAVLVAHPQQQLVVTAAFALGFLDADDRLEIQLESILFDGAGNPRDPLHLLVAQRCVAVLVEMHLVAAHVLRGVAGDVGGTHDACDVGAVAADHDDTDRTAHGRKRVLPLEAIALDRAADGLGDLHGALIVTAL